MADKMEIKVSVVMPVYNAADYLQESLGSILTQSLREIEVICVNDGSTDNSLEILERYQKDDDRIKIINQKNQYAGVARNNGLKVARGEYVIFWDADDFFHQNALRGMYEKAKETAADIVICNSNVYDDVNKQILPGHGSLIYQYLPQKDVFSYKDIPEYIFQISFGWPWDKLFRTEFVRKQKLQFHTIRTSEDVQFVFPALVMADKITVIDKEYVTYRKYNQSSLENTFHLSWKSILVMIDSLWKELENRNLSSALQRSFDNFAVEHIVLVVCFLGNMNAYKEMYNEIQKDILVRYKFIQHNQSYYYEKFWYEQLCRLQNYTAEEYLMYEMRRIQNEYDRHIKYVKALELHNRWLEKVYIEHQHKVWMFPYEQIPKNADVVIYGAGAVGKDFYKQIQQTQWCNVVAWVDKNAAEYKSQGLKVERVETLKDIEFDYIIISVVKSEIAKEIKKQLLQKGVIESKIIGIDFVVPI